MQSSGLFPQSNVGNFVCSRSHPYESEPTQSSWPSRFHLSKSKSSTCAHKTEVVVDDPLRLSIPEFSRGEFWFIAEDSLKTLTIHYKSFSMVFGWASWAYHNNCFHPTYSFLGVTERPRLRRISHARKITYSNSYLFRSWNLEFLAYLKLVTSQKLFYCRHDIYWPSSYDN